MIFGGGVRCYCYCFCRAALLCQSGRMSRTNLKKERLRKRKNKENKSQTTAKKKRPPLAGTNLLTFLCAYLLQSQTHGGLFLPLSLSLVCPTVLTIHHKNGCRRLSQSRTRLRLNPGKAKLSKLHA